MISILLLASVAIGIASDTAHNGGYNLRLPLRRRESPTIETRGEPVYGQNPLRTNATQKHYLSPYTVELAIGSPPQLVYPAIDLFSNDLWVDPDCSMALSHDACCANGNYNPNVSSTAEVDDCSQPWEFSSPYGSASGCNVVDDVQFAGADLGYIQVGVANQSWDQTAGRLGLGFGCKATGDVSILDRLKLQGLITSRQFSIGLGSANPIEGSQDASSDAGLGELLFSGLNARKYSGLLQQLDSRPSTEGDSSYYVTLSQIGLTDPSNCKFVKIFTIPSVHAVFDFTTIISYLPFEYMVPLTEFFPDGFYNLTEGVYQVPCFHRTHDATIDFYFDNLAISVPMRDFILEVDGTCYLGVVRNAELDEGEAILGLSFLRGAYTVFDLDNEAIWMAQYEDCGDDVIDWDSSNIEQYGLCAAKPTTFPFNLDDALDGSLYKFRNHNDSLNNPNDTLDDPINDTFYDKLQNHLNEPLNEPLNKSFHNKFKNDFNESLDDKLQNKLHQELDTFQLSPRSNVLERTQFHSNNNIFSDPKVIHDNNSNYTAISGGSSIFFTQSSGGFSWSNVSFTPGSTGRWTPKPTTTGSLTTSSEKSTLTSIPASSTTSTTKKSSTSSSSRRSTGSSSGTETGTLTFRQSAEKTVTVTVGVLTSTVFMPSPITIPVSTCKCSATVTVTAGSEETEMSTCEATSTEYRTRTVTESHCGTTAHTTREAESVTPSISFIPVSPLLSMD
ncbi:acid protease [Xylariaceae sp. AK1471]|nr:acid protease [Xylariaceae sp. AK1471]